MARPFLALRCFLDLDLGIAGGITGAMPMRPANPDETTQFPPSTLVNYVRAYSARY